LANPIIGRFSDHEAVAACVNNLLEIGIKKGDISLMTHHAEESEAIQNSSGIFQKNGDISSQTGGIVVGGVLGSIFGSLIGVATFTIPQVGLVVGAGSLMTTLCGGILGGTIGDKIVKTMDAPYSDTNPIHPYIAALKEGDILCGVETDALNENDILKIMSKYAARLVP
jgi:hypothetical protein